MFSGSIDKGFSSRMTNGIDNEPIQTLGSFDRHLLQQHQADEYLCIGLALATHMDNR